MTADRQSGESVMKCVSISEARRLANETSAEKLLILAVDGKGNFAFTTFGKTKAQCSAMREWAESNAPNVALLMDEL